MARGAMAKGATARGATEKREIATQPVARGVSKRRVRARGAAALVVTIVASALAGCDEASTWVAWTREPWTGFVHPKRGDVLGVVEIGRFDSLEECRAAALDTLARAGWSNVGDYACGQGCRERAGLVGPFTCRRTET